MSDYFYSLEMIVRGEHYDRMTYVDHGLLLRLIADEENQ